MPNSASQIVVGGSGTIYVAPVGSTAPTDSSTALAAAWLDLGYISEDGVTCTFGKTTEAIRAWQSLYPVRRIATEATMTLSFSMRQWNKTSLPLALGGGTLTTVTAGKFKYVPASPDTIDQRALIVAWSDGTKTYRLYVPTGMVVDNVEMNITRSNSADLPITFEATPSSGDAYTLFTNDTALDPA